MPNSLWNKDPQLYLQGLLVLINKFIHDIDLYVPL